MKIEAIIGLITIVSSTVSGVVMFFVGRRGRVTQVEQTEIGNLKQIIDSQKEEALYFKSELVELRAAFNRLQDEFIEYKKKIRC